MQGFNAVVGVGDSNSMINFIQSIIFPAPPRGRLASTAQRLCNNSAHLKQLNRPNEMRNGFLRTPCLSTVTPPPARRPPQFFVYKKGIEYFPSLRGWSLSMETSERTRVCDFFSVRDVCREGGCMGSDCIL